MGEVNYNIHTLEAMVAVISKDLFSAIFSAIASATQLRTILEVMELLAF